MPAAKWFIVLFPISDPILFKNNPTSMSSRLPDYSVVSAPNPLAEYGVMVLNSPTLPGEVTLTGYFYDNTERNLFESLHESDVPFYIVDHNLYGSLFLSTVLAVDERRPTARNPNRFEYTWTLMNLTLGEIEFEDSP
jgi:hypothetical protein